MVRLRSLWLPDPCRSRGRGTGQSARRLKLGLSKQLTVFMDSHDVTTYAASNTFSLFAEYGGLAFEGPESGTRQARIPRDKLQDLVECMKHWVATPGAANAAESVRSDLGYVSSQIDRLMEFLSNPRWAYKRLIIVEISSTDETRQDEAGAPVANAYSYSPYTSPPEY